MEESIIEDNNEIEIADNYPQTSIDKRVDYLEKLHFYGMLVVLGVVAVYFINKK